MASLSLPTIQTDKIADFITKISPGFFVAVLIAVTSQFLSEHYGAPAMLMALLIGIAFHFLAEDGKCVPGIEFTAKKVIRIGVALLGARISVDLLVALGPGVIIMTIAAIGLTVAFAMLGARLLGRGWRLAILTGGSVAICGASAAMAIAAVLPKNEHSERNLVFTVLSVTLLSTVAMIAYPILANYMGLNTQQTGVFLGATIHDVAQVVGAGFSVSDQAGDTATVVKLIRVTMLAPFVLILALILRQSAAEQAEAGGDTQRPPLLPGFVAAFLIIATINSLGLIPVMVADAIGEISKWALLVAIAAVGMKTSLKRMFDVGGTAITLIIGETIFIAVFVAVCLTLI
ncbi:MAG: YeiH family protein [Pseudomonadota bacterium]